MATVVGHLGVAALEGRYESIVFMEPRVAENFTRLAAGAAFFWIAILFALTFNDLASRGLRPRRPAPDRSAHAVAARRTLQ